MSDRVAIVTGGGRGVGVEIARTLAEDGQSIVIAGRDRSRLDRLAAELSEQHPQHPPLAIRCDVTSEADAKALAAGAIERFGRIDLLVNAAGVTGPLETPAHELTAEDLRAVLEANVIGTFLACRAMIPTFVEQGYGRIVNISGTASLRGYPNRAAYAASKWAIRGLTRTLALEVGSYGITVNAVCPTAIIGSERIETVLHTRAERLGRSYDDLRLDFASQTALGRGIEARDVAEAVRFLGSDGARSITGTDFVVDAGWAV